MRPCADWLEKLKTFEYGTHIHNQSAHFGYAILSVLAVVALLMYNIRITPQSKSLWGGVLAVYLFTLNPILMCLVGIKRQAGKDVDQSLDGKARASAIKSMLKNAGITYKPMIKNFAIAAVVSTVYYFIAT